jgi:hypothetical protein
MIKPHTTLREEAGELESAGGGLGTGFPVSDGATEQPVTPAESVDSYQQFISSLPEDMRNNPTIQNTKSFDSLASQLVNAQSALGSKRLQAPQEDWGDTEWESFYSELRPKESYKIPEEVSISDAYDNMEIPQQSEESLKELTDFATEVGLTQKQFDGLYSRYTELQLEGTSKMEGYNKDTIHKFGADMAEHWGHQFEVNMKAANQTYESLAQEIPELAELINWSPIVANHPAVLKLFHKISEISGDAIPTSGNNSASPFGQAETVQGIRSQIQQLDTDNEGLIMTDPASLSLADRNKREDILQKRIKLYSKMYGN